MDDLVSTEWLAANLGQPDLVVVDSSFFMPSSGRDARAEYLAAHIPGARFLDVDELSDKANPAPHMLPSAQDFGRAMETLGIGRDDRIIVYDNSPLRTAARGWFMLRHFGASKVAILDGGLQKWAAEERAVESGEPAPRGARFEAVERAGEIVSLDDISAGLGTALIDARGKARFEGSEPDPRPGVAAGHIPGARNLPFVSLYKDDGTFRSRDEIAQTFAVAGADPHAPFVATCGSGVTANSLIFAAHLLGNRATRLYDGSWSEWGADPSTPKEIGARLGPLHQARDVLEAEADLFRNPLARGGIGLAARGTLGQQGLQTRRRGARGAAGAAVETAVGGLARCAPAGGKPLVFVGVRGRSTAERIDQPQRMANARQPRQCLGIWLGRLVEVRNGSKVKHPAAVTADG